MKIQLIRNATMKMEYGGRTILTDPMLCPKDAIDPFAGIARNPTVELPFDVDGIVEGVDGVVVSHDHPDHFDKAASDALPKTTPIFCQPGDEARMSGEGFQNVAPVETSREWEGIDIIRTGGEHGSGEILKMMGESSGFVFRTEGEPTVYWVGDSIWCAPVEEAIETYAPDVVITHSGGAKLPGHDVIIMDDKQTLAAAHAAPNAVIVAIHLEALDHCGVTREALRRTANDAAMPSSRLMIPNDGETIVF